MAGLRVQRVTGGVALTGTAEGTAAGTTSWNGTAAGVMPGTGTGKLRVTRITAGVIATAGTPPSGNTTTRIGGRVNLPGSASETAEFATGETYYGILQCTKDYFSGGSLPASYSPPYPGRVLVLYSMARDTNLTNANFATFVASLPAGTLLTFQHEPERPQFGWTGAEYVAQLNDFRTKVRAVRTDIPVWMFSSGYQYRTGNPGYSGSFFTGNQADGYGYDGYRDGTNNTEQGGKVIPLQDRDEFNRWLGFVPDAKRTAGAFGASEVGFGRCDEPGLVADIVQQRIDSTKSSAEWCIAQHAAVFLYFFSGQGPDGHNWLPVDAGFKTMYQALPRMAAGTGVGAASGNWTWAGTATGRTIRRGTSTGTIAWHGAATGVRLAAGAHSGSSFGGWFWLGNAFGNAGGPIPVVIAVPAPPGLDDTLGGPRITDFRFDVLDRAEHLIGTLTSVTGGSVDWVARNAIKGGGTLDVADPDAGAVDWLNVRIRPVVLLSPADINTPAEEVPVGVFLPSAPVESWDATGRTVKVELLDKNAVLDQDIPVGVDGQPVTYTADVGANVVERVQILILETGELTPAIVPGGKLLTTPMTWDIGTTRLTIINDLLDAANYFSLWCDGRGQYQVTPYVDAQDRTPIYEMLAPFTVGQQSLMAPEWSRDADLYDVPNRYVAVTAGSGDTPALKSTAENLDPASPFSYQSRGRWITRVLTNAEAASQDDLDAIARRGLSATTSVTTAITVDHAFLPDLRVHETIRFTNLDAGLRILTEVNKTSIPFDSVALCRSELLAVPIL